MVVLATKVYVSGQARDRALDALETLVANALDGLDATYEIGLRHDDFPSVTVQGEDATVARNLLAEQWGAIEPTHDEGATYVGTLTSWDDDGWVLDAGEPVRIPADRIELGPGRPSQVIERFGVVQHQRLQFDWGDPPALAEVERDQLYEWRRGPGRVNINSVTRAEARRAVNRAGHADDITGIDRIGLLEQSIRCAPGTDPPGLLASIGPYLQGEMRCVVSSGSS